MNLPCNCTTHKGYSQKAQFDDSILPHFHAILFGIYIPLLTGFLTRMVHDIVQLHHWSCQGRFPSLVDRPCSMTMLLGIRQPLGHSPKRDIPALCIPLSNCQTIKMKQIKNDILLHWSVIVKKHIIIFHFFMKAVVKSSSHACIIMMTITRAFYHYCQKSGCENLLGMCKWCRPWIHLEACTDAKKSQPGGSGPLQHCIPDPDSLL